MCRLLLRVAEGDGLAFHIETFALIRGHHLVWLSLAILTDFTAIPVFFSPQTESSAPTGLFEVVDSSLLSGGDYFQHRHVGLFLSMLVVWQRLRSPAFVGQLALLLVLGKEMGVLGQLVLRYKLTTVDGHRDVLFHRCRITFNLLYLQVFLILPVTGLNHILSYRTPFGQISY